MYSLRETSFKILSKNEKKFCFRSENGVRTSATLHDPSSCKNKFEYLVKDGKMIPRGHECSKKIHQTPDFSRKVLRTAWSEIEPSIMKLWTKIMLDIKEEPVIIKSTTMTFGRKNTKLPDLKFETLVEAWKSLSEISDHDFSTADILQKFLDQLTGDFGFPSLKEFDVNSEKYIDDFVKKKIMSRKNDFDQEKAVKDFEEFKEVAATKQFKTTTDQHVSITNASHSDDDDCSLTDDEQSVSNLVIFHDEVHESNFPGSALVQYGNDGGWEKTGSKVHVKPVKKGTIRIDKDTFSYVSGGVYRSDNNRKLRFIRVLSLPYLVLKD